MTGAVLVRDNTKRLRRLTEAESNMLMENRRLIGYVYRVSFERQYKRWADELKSAGLTGLWSAVQHYDKSLSRFSTYATMCIWERMACVVRDWSREEAFTLWSEDVPRARLVVPYCSAPADGMEEEFDELLAQVKELSDPVSWTFFEAFFFRGVSLAAMAEHHGRTRERMRQRVYSVWRELRRRLVALDYVLPENDGQRMVTRSMRRGSIKEKEERIQQEIERDRSTTRASRRDANDPQQQRQKAR